MTQCLKEQALNKNVQFVVGQNIISHFFVFCLTLGSNQAVSALQSHYSCISFSPLDTWKAWCSLFTFWPWHVKARRTWVAFFPLHTFPTFFSHGYKHKRWNLEINPKVSHSPFIIIMKKNSSLIIIGRMYSHRMVLAPQADLVVQEVQVCLFLENLVNQSDQEVLVVPPHLWIMIRKCSICRQMEIDYLRPVSQISAVPFTP